ncbi:unnamed protein product, partial [Brenthis ino]
MYSQVATRKGAGDGDGRFEVWEREGEASSYAGSPSRAAALASLCHLRRRRPVILHPVTDAYIFVLRDLFGRKETSIAPFPKTPHSLQNFIQVS